MKTIYIDGGGTKTTGYWIEDNQIKAKLTCGPSNINNDYKKALKNILKILNNFQPFNSIQIGVAGVLSNKENKNKLFNLISQKFFSKICVYSDIELFARLIQKFNRDFILINLGTGTSVVESKKNKFNYYLGWGKIINDIGSGYDIGISFLKYLCKCEDTNDLTKYYKEFLINFKLKTIRDYLPEINDYQNVCFLTQWIFLQGDEYIKKFVLPRIEKLLDYISFLKSEFVYCSGSIILKNELVKQQIKNFFKDSKVKFKNFEDLIIKN